MSCTTKQTICDETDGQHVVKRSKFDYDDQNFTELKSTMNVLSVIDDCLVEIFVYLSINDLLNVSATNVRFKIPTERAFVRKHLNVPVTVSNIDAGCVDGKMLETSIKMLQHFGHCITKLSIKFKLENIGRLLEAIVKYSGNSIIKLIFCHVTEEWYMKLHRTGLRRIKRQLRELKINFPNLLKLKFEYKEIVDCPYSDEIIQAIPTLTYFSASGAIFSHEDVNKFIALNGQLQSLKLWVPNGFITQGFINNLDASLPRLKTLKLNRVTIEGNLEPINPQRYNSLRKLLYGGVSASFPTNGLSSLFGEDIEDLELYCSNYYITNLMESISRFRKLKRLSMYFPPNVHAASLPRFEMSIVSPTAIQELILRSNQLTEIEIDWHYQRAHFELFQNKYNDFKDKSKGAQWHVCVRQHFDEAVRLIRIIVLFSKEKQN